MNNYRYKFSKIRKRGFRIKIAIALIVVALFGAGGFYFFGQDIDKPSELYDAEVLRVVDGDTIKVNFNGAEETVRFIGVDTPESVHPDKEKNVPYGKVASDYTKEKLDGKTVRLEFDVEERDRYGRLLAYVYIGDQMFNKMLLEDGHAMIATYPPNVKYVEDFTAIQKKARKEGKGAWGEDSAFGKDT